MKRLCLTGALVAAMAAPTFAAYFDFELLPNAFSGSVTDTQSGLTLTAVAEPTGFMYVSSGSDGECVGMGSRALIGSQNPFLASNGFAPVRITFSSALSFVSLQAGDAGGDDDGLIVVDAYDSSNLLVDSDSVAHGLGDVAIKTLTLSGSGISYLICSTTAADNKDSVFWDNIRTDPVPEPASMVALGVGALAMIRRRRK